MQMRASVWVRHDEVKNKVRSSSTPGIAGRWSPECLVPSTVI